MVHSRETSPTTLLVFVPVSKPATAAALPRTTGTSKLSICSTSFCNLGSIRPPNGPRTRDSAPGQLRCELPTCHDQLLFLGYGSSAGPMLLTPALQLERPYAPFIESTWSTSHLLSTIIRCPPQYNLWYISIYVSFALVWDSFHH
jgi:hypothetical protein